MVAQNWVPACSQRATTATNRVQTWTERIDKLVEGSEWLDALRLALDHYEECVHEIQELADIASERAQRIANAGGQGKHNHSVCTVHAVPPAHLSCTRLLSPPAYDPGLIERMRARPVSSHVRERVESLLMRFVHLMFANAPAVESPAAEVSKDASATLAELGRSRSRTLNPFSEQYTYIAGVCIEYCVVANRLDLLFGAIFERFRSAGKEVSSYRPGGLKTIAGSTYSHIVHALPTPDGPVGDVGAVHSQ